MSTEDDLAFDSLSIQDIEKMIQTWPAKDREQALERYKRRTSGENRVWFCKRGRTCDGEPHEGVPYSHARDDQWPPRGFDWLVWLIMSGRGSGKTRTGSEWCVETSKLVPRMAMVGRRGKDVRATMVEGDSGLIKVCESHGIDYTWQPTKMEFTFGNGAMISGFSAEEPDSMRGPQYGAGWLDEPAHMDKIEDVWDNLTLGMRLKGYPGGAKILCTSTPLPIKWLKDLIVTDGTVKVSVSTSKNLKNLDENYKRRIIDPLAGTRKGRQELDGELLEDVPGALWKDAMFRRVQIDLDLMQFDRIVTAVDPAGTANRRSDLTGIVTVGKIGRELYVIDDRSGKYGPTEWANKAIQAAETFGSDAIVAEKNYGGDMVNTTIMSVLEKRDDFNVRVLITTAMRSKELRAEPTVAIYEQKRAFHMAGADLKDLETEQTTWVPGHGASPNRIDALVWGADELFGGASTESDVASPVGQRIDNVAPARPTAVASEPEPTVDANGVPTSLFLPSTFVRRRAS